MPLTEDCQVDEPHGLWHKGRQMRRLYVRKDGGKGFEAIGWICRRRHVKYDREAP